MWHDVNDWLLRELLAFLDENDIYRLWVVAEEHGLARVAAYLTVSSPWAPLSRTRALHLAMAHACWTAVHRLTKAPRSPRLSRRTLGLVLQEIARHVVPCRDHPDRERAMLTSAPPRSVPQCVMYCAARLGSLESVIWLHSVTQYDPSEALRIASRNRHGHVVAWLLDNVATAPWINPGCSIGTLFHFRDDPRLGVCAWKVFYGDEQVDEAAFSSEWGFTDLGSSGTTEYRAADLAAVHGDLDGVQRILSHEVFQNACTIPGVEDTARAGHLHVLQWLHAFRPDLIVEANVFHAAASSGHLDVAQWAAGISIKEETLDMMYDEIVRRGHLIVLQWMVDQFPTSASLHLDESYLSRACKEGHLHMVAWFVEERKFQVTSRALMAAAMGGQLDVFQWILSRLPPTGQDDASLDPVLLRQAARSGNATFVRWLVEECGLWNPSALTAAARGGSTEIVEYLYSVASARGEGRLNPRELENPSSIQRGQFDMLTWRLNHGIVAAHLTKPGFDHVRNTERTLESVQQNLGWSEHALVHERWTLTPSSVGKFRALVRLIIEVYDPVFLRSATWLPWWAIQHGTISTLERLAKIGHSQLLTPKTFRQLLHRSSDTDKVQWFLTRSPSLFSTRVVQWAVQYDKRRLLAWLLDEFVPLQQSDPESHPNLSFRCAETAIKTAQRCGRTEITRWLQVSSGGTNPGPGRIK